jgi:Eukaryotic aspartyl protease
LFDARKIEHNLFALCYRRELGTSKRGVTAGSMTIGGLSNNLDTSPMVYAKNLAQAGWYTVFVKAIYIRTGGGQSARSDMDSDSKHKTIKVRLNQKVLNSGKGVIVDSGTTDTYLNKRLAKEFNRAWKAATGQSYTHSPMTLTVKQLHSLPTILIQCMAYSKDSDLSMDDFENIPGYAGNLDPLSPKDLLIAIPATSYMDYSAFSKKYTSRLYFSESHGGVLGANTMQGHNVLFDWQNGRVGFAESSCTYDKKNTPKSVIDDRYPTDCELSNPILTKSCVETVDHRMCANNPTNIALLGIEEWTAIVLSPGNEAGISCVKAAHGITVEAATGSNNNDPVVSCDGMGVCVEKRPCQLTCSQLEKAIKVRPETKPKKAFGEQQGECGDAYWSACDYGCFQTKIESKLYSDGLCHEVAAENRACHVGACARTDPCRVPFIVHTVLGFRNGQVARWNRNAKEILVTALTDTIDEIHKSKNESRTFSEGDVHVVSAIDWYLEDYEDEYDNTIINTDDSNEQNEWGVKVVVEISINNPNAAVSRRTTINQKNQIDVIDPLTKIVQNITDRVRGTIKQQQQHSCQHDELYVLAKHALVTKRAFREESFMTSLIRKIQNQTKGEVKASAPFGPISALGYNISQSRLLSAWTIRTGLEEDVNYFGPPKPLSSSILVIVQNITVLCTIFLAALLVWNYSTTVYDYVFGGKYSIDWDPTSFFPRGFRRHRRRSVNDRSEDDASDDPTLLDSKETSKRRHKSFYESSTPKKRTARKEKSQP